MTNSAKHTKHNKWFKLAEDISWRPDDTLSQSPNIGWCTSCDISPRCFSENIYCPFRTKYEDKWSNFKKENGLKYCF